VPVVFRALDVSHQIRRSPLSRLIKRAERYIYANASLVSANNPAMAEYCIELSGRLGPTSVDLPPVDLTHFEEPTRSVREDLGIGEDERVIVYMGSFFEFSGLDIVVERLAPTLRAESDLRLLLVGGGDLDASLRARVAELGLENQIVFTGIIPYAKLPAYLRAGTVAINPFRPQLLTDVAFPHKVLQYMAAGVPAVSTSLRGLRGVLGDEAGVTWATGPGTIAETALRIANLPRTERELIAERQRAFVKATFSKESAVESFESSLGSVR
jgi:glycosyltransferase involved in cell wall biosynthesis